MVKLWGHNLVKSWHLSQFSITHNMLCLRTETKCGACNQYHKCLCHHYPKSQKNLLLKIFKLQMQANKNKKLRFTSRNQSLNKLNCKSNLKQTNSTKSTSKATLTKFFMCYERVRQTEQNFLWIKTCVQCLINFINDRLF